MVGSSPPDWARCGFTDIEGNCLQAMHPTSSISIFHTPSLRLGYGVVCSPPKTQGLLQCVFGGPHECHIYKHVGLVSPCVSTSLSVRVQCSCKDLSTLSCHFRHETMVREKDKNVFHPKKRVLILTLQKVQMFHFRPKQ